jgi:2-polyprenyl-3-methyl-5-hydroxy-6-metoxy-1,4-benzoquinol methylase
MPGRGHTVERINPEFFRTREKYLLYLRHVFAYEHVVAELSAPVKLLEVGMGDGYGAALLASAGHDVTAVDVDEATVAFAAERYSGDLCRFMVYGGRRLPFDDASFDAVVSMQVIEHVEEDVAFVRELQRVLRPGGRCWLTTPNRPQRVANDQPVWNTFHRREYWAHQLQSVLEPVFRSVVIRAISAREGVRQLERDRVRRGFNLRKLVPEPIRAMFDGDLAGLDTSLFYVTTPAEAYLGIDLLAECRRSD